MSNLTQRILAGLVFTAVVLASAWSGPLLLGLLFGIFAGIGLYELYSMEHRNQHFAPRKKSGMMTGILIYILLALRGMLLIETAWLWVLTIPIVLLLCFELFRPGTQNLNQLALTGFGWLYVILPFSMINFLGQIHGTYESELVIGYFIILWSNDSGAYAIGRMLGKHKLFERVSPNKTWEGLFGGVAMAMVASYILAQYFDSISQIDWMAIACIVGVFANLGDLFESHIKRIFGIKDSGNLIPGHGGALDRFDGLLLSLPIVIAYFQISQLL